MDEFSLIEHFFQSIPNGRKDVIFGIGDDAACLQVPNGYQLLVSSDTLVADVHFCQSWDAYDIAFKAAMVNISDIAAMGGSPCWITLALTMPVLDELWLQRFSQGLKAALGQFDVALVGGDTTRGPLSMTLTIHGLVPENRAIRRSGAKPGDLVYVSGELGAAAFAVQLMDPAFALQHAVNLQDMAVLQDTLQHPRPRIDLAPVLQKHATSAIDISDGLSSDLHHICVASRVGAYLSLDSIPVHPLVKKYLESGDSGHGTGLRRNALDFALNGGDDYEICFTVSPEHEPLLLKDLAAQGLRCFPVGVIDAGAGLWARAGTGELVPVNIQGYQHF